MRPDHLYYKEVNEKDGAYYRRWASVFGPNMSEVIDRILKSPRHEEQAYNSCAGILHSVKELPHGIVESRDCQKATIIISQLPVVKWWELFKDNTYADACLSRMVHKAYRLECNGRDMRKPL